MKRPRLFHKTFETCMLELVVNLSMHFIDEFPLLSELKGKVDISRVKALIYLGASSKVATVKQRVLDGFNYELNFFDDDEKLASALFYSLPYYNKITHLQVKQWLETIEWEN